MKNEPIQPHLRQARSGEKEQGIALFVVLVVSVVLSVVVFQLSYTSKIEERIAKNRRTLLDNAMTLPSVARMVIAKLNNKTHDLAGRFRIKASGRFIDQQ